MTDVDARLRQRAADAGVALPDPLAERLLSYYALLSHWNKTINLTSLRDADGAVDRLLLEPVAAAYVIQRHLQPSTRLRLIDFGSGGGSPAIPLAFVLSPELLVMVESRARKTAFLREAVRELSPAPAVRVESLRFEQLSGDPELRQQMDLVSVRAVRVDAVLLSSASSLLRSGGCAVLFHAAGGQEWSDAAAEQFDLLATEGLLKGSPAQVTLLRRRDVPGGLIGESKK